MTNFLLRIVFFKSKLVHLEYKLSNTNQLKKILLENLFQKEMVFLGNQKILIITAYPDEESLYFGPLILCYSIQTISDFSACQMETQEIYGDSESRSSREQSNTLDYKDIDSLMTHSYKTNLMLTEIRVSYHSTF